MLLRRRHLSRRPALPPRHRHAARRTSLGDNTFLGNHVVIPGGARAPRRYPGRASRTVADASHDPPRHLVVRPSAVRAAAPRGGRGRPPADATSRPGRATSTACSGSSCASRCRSSRCCFASSGSRSARSAPRTIPQPLTFSSPCRRWRPGGAAVSRALRRWRSSGCSSGASAPGQHPLWSCWCSRWDFLYVAWGAYARRPGDASRARCCCMVPARDGLESAGGSCSAAASPRSSIPTCWTIERRRHGSACFQAHTFEDRVLKIDRVTIGAGARSAAARCCSMARTSARATASRRTAWS